MKMPIPGAMPPPMIPPKGPVTVKKTVQENGEGEKRQEEREIKMTDTTGLLSFSVALDMLKKGFRMARQGWNGKDMFVFLVPGSIFAVNRPPLLGIYPEGTHVSYHAHIDMKTAQGYIVPWLASQADLLAEDWMFVATQDEVDEK